MRHFLLIAASLIFLCSQGVLAAEYNCSSCLECSDYLQNGTLSSGDTLNLEADMTGQGVNCIEFGGVDNITLDCRGFAISGDGSTGYGIWLNDSGGGANSNTITGCTNISYFQFGIYMEYSDNTTLANITTSYNDMEGIYIDSSHGNTLTDIASTDNVWGGGIYFTYSDNNTITSAVVSDNPQWDGISMDYSNNNVLTNITGSGLDNGFCISMQSCTNNTVTDVTATLSYGGIYLLDFSYDNSFTGINSSYNEDGIYILDSVNNTFTDVTADGNLYMGFYFLTYNLPMSGNNTISDSSADGNGEYGFYIYSSNNNTITNVTASHNVQYGIRVYNQSYYNTIKDSRIENNSIYGIFLDDQGTNYPSHNLFYNNYINNSVNLYSDNENNTNWWNASLDCAGDSNIIGCSCIGGNFWTDPDGSNFSDECTDSDLNGICDVSYTPAANNTDYLPLICVEQWSCSGWSECPEEGVQTRSCTDLNHCGTTSNMPALSQSCEYQRPRRVGGGGTPPVTLPSITKIIDSIVAGPGVSFSVNKPGLNITDMAIRVRNEVRNVYIKVTGLPSRPSCGGHNVSGIVYQYLDVENRNIEDGDIESCHIGFMVSRSWIAGKGINKSEVYLNRCQGSQWSRLNTTLLREDSEYVYYQAEAPGFSSFAISGGPGYAVQACVPGERRCHGSEIQECSPSGEWASLEECGHGCDPDRQECMPEPETAPEPEPVGQDYAWLLYPALAVLLTSVLVLIISKKPRKRKKR